MSIVLNNVVYPAGYIAEDDGPLKAGRNYINTDNVTTDNVTINGTLTWNNTTMTGSAVTVSGMLPGGSTDTTLYATPYDTSSFVFLTNNPDPTQATFKFVLANTPLMADTRYTADSDPNLTEYDADPPCFAAGTAIATVHGDVAVEDLAVGDVLVNAAGDHRAIRWLGHRVIDCRRHPRPQDVQPIRIVAHAFGECRPARDLYVSPGHAICVDVFGEVLVPAGALVNGSTIQQVAVDEVTYWHVELETHDVILAENLPTESYLEMGNRGFFHEAVVVDLVCSPDSNASQRTHADFCRPFHATGAVSTAARLQLSRRAQELQKSAFPVARAG